MNVTTKSDIIPEKQFVDNPFDENKQLKPSVRYKSGEYDYIGESDYLGRVVEYSFSELHTTQRTSRLRYNSKTPGKLKGDHAGHIIADRFGGSPNLDNLVSQASEVNQIQYANIEKKWYNAIKNGKIVSGRIKIKYLGESRRPASFSIDYEIDRYKYHEYIKNEGGLNNGKSF